jgi:hypothetical protein
MTSSWSERYRLHFQKQFQKPFDIQIYHSSEIVNPRTKSGWGWLGSWFSAPEKSKSPDGSSLKLATHDWAMAGFRVYASMGLADRLVQNGEEEFGEVILFSDLPDKEVPQLFVHALFFILHNDISLGSRFAIGGIYDLLPEFAARYRKSALYFTRATAEAHTTKQIASGEKVDYEETINKVRNGDEFGWVYQAYFITPEEDEYLEDNGADAFEKMLQAEGVDRLSLRRPSCV